MKNSVRALRKSVTLLLALVSPSILIAEDECPEETPLVFSLRAPGAVAEGELNTVDVHVLPGADVTVDVTAYLETNPPGQTITVDLCGLFQLAAAHDPQILRLDDVMSGEFFFFGGRAVEDPDAGSEFAPSPAPTPPTPTTTEGRTSPMRLESSDSCSRGIRRHLHQDRSAVVSIRRMMV